MKISFRTVLFLVLGIGLLVGAQLLGYPVLGYLGGLYAGLLWPICAVVIFALLLYGLQYGPWLLRRRRTGRPAPTVRVYLALILRFFAPKYRITTLFSLLLMTVGIYSRVSSLSIIIALPSAYLLHAPISMGLTLLGSWLLLDPGSGGIAAVNTIVHNRVGRGVLEDLRSELVELYVDPKFLDRQPEITAQFKYLADTLDSPTDALVNVLWTGALAILPILRLGAAYPPLAICLGASVVIMLALNLGYFAPRISGKMQALQASAGTMMGRLQELGGRGAVWTIKQFDSKLVILQRLQQINAAITRLAHERRIFDRLNYTQPELFVGGGTALALGLLLIGLHIPKASNIWEAFIAVPPLQAAGILTVSLTFAASLKVTFQDFLLFWGRLSTMEGAFIPIFTLLRDGKTQGQVSQAGHALVPQRFHSLRYRDFVVTIPGTDGTQPARIVIKDLELFPKEIVIIKGPSGTGKSLFVAATGGHGLECNEQVYIIAEDRSETRLADLAQRGEAVRICYPVPLLMQGTVLNNIIEIAHPGSNANEARIIEMLSDMGLLAELQDRGGVNADVGPGGTSLSTGQRVRIGLVRAMSGWVPILVFDEPFANLDTKSGKAFAQLLRKLVSQNRILAIVISHQQPPIPGFADRYIDLKRQGNEVKVVGAGYYAPLRHAIQSLAQRFR